MALSWRLLTISRLVSRALELVGSEYTWSSVATVSGIDVFFKRHMPSAHCESSLINDVVIERALVALFSCATSAYSACNIAIFIE